MSVHERTVPTATRPRARTSRLAALTAALRASAREARISAERSVIRGQLGPSVGQRHDRRPERYL